MNKKPDFSLNENIVSNIADALSGKSAHHIAETVAIAKTIQAAEILSDSGFEDEAGIVLAILQDVSLEKIASLDEEILFDVKG